VSLRMKIIVRAIVTVVGLLAGLFGLLFGALFGFVWFVFRDYEPIYIPHGMTQPARQAEEFFQFAVMSLVAALIGGMLLTVAGLSDMETPDERDRMRPFTAA
jgi:uncharacterized membrane protein